MPCVWVCCRVHQPGGGGAYNDNNLWRGRGVAYVLERRCISPSHALTVNSVHSMYNGVETWQNVCVCGVGWGGGGGHIPKFWVWKWGGAQTYLCPPLWKVRGAHAPPPCPPVPTPVMYVPLLCDITSTGSPHVQRCHSHLMCYLRQFYFLWYDDTYMMDHYW